VDSGDESAGISGPRGGTLKPFPKGVSGNPSGRPKSLPRFRARNRKAAPRILSEILRRIGDNDVPVGEWVKAFEAICGMGGFLPLDKDAAVEVGKFKVALSLMALDGLTADQRGKFLEALKSVGDE
jgi:hypothetical protein